MTTARAQVQSFDVDAVRADFPCLQQQIRGRTLAYLDNAATSQVPSVVSEAVARFDLRDRANVHRAVHELSQRATTAYDASRTIAQRFLGAADEREVVFTSGTTASINLVAQTWGRANLGPGDEILVSHMEHHSNIVPWQLLCAERGATLRVIPVDDRGQLRMDTLDELINDRTRLVGLVHASNALGTINPVDEIIRRAHAVGARVLLDGAQAAPHLPVNVSSLGADFYALSGHKVCAPTGTGILYGKLDLLREMPPWQGGGDMIDRVSFDGTTYAEPPARFEAGTPNIGGVIGLGAALEYLSGLDFSAVEQHEQALLAHATEELSRVDGLTIIGTADQKVSVVSFVVDGVHPHDLGTLLDQYGVAVRTGHHCAEPLMRRFEVSATTRASFAFYNTHAEVEALANGIRKALRLLR